MSPDAGPRSPASACRRQGRSTAKPARSSPSRRCPAGRSSRSQQTLAGEFGLPVIVENDGIAAANGEWKFGSARGLRHFVYVTVSTGIGGGVVVDGRLLHGRRGMAGHVGHMIIEPDGPLCSCGAHGCFEALASGSALARSGREAVSAAPSSLLARARPADAITARDIVAAARQGDSLALTLLEREATWLGIGFSNLAHLYSPQAIVMGGGVSQAFDLLHGEHRDDVSRIGHAAVS